MHPAQSAEYLRIVAIGPKSDQENSPEIFALFRRNRAQPFVNNAEIIEKMY